MHDAERAAVALAHAFLDRAPASPFNVPISPLRDLAMVSRPRPELRQIKQRCATSINDVVLAVCAGAVRRRSAAQVYSVVDTGVRISGGQAGAYR